MQPNKEPIPSEVAYSERPIVVLSLPMESNVRVLNPESVMVKVGTNCIDIGSLCFLRRSDKRRRNNNSGAEKTYYPKLVDTSSFQESRIIPIRSLIQFLSDWIGVQGQRPAAVHSRVGVLLRFMAWADTSGHQQVLSAGNAPYLAFREYVAYLRERVQQNDLELVTATREQNDLYNFLGAWLDLHDLHRGVNLLQEPRGRNGARRTEPPSEDDLGRMIGLCDALFNGFTDLALDGKPFPFHLPVPKSLGWEDNGLWIFPTNRWCLPPHLSLKREQLANCGWTWDYKEGGLRSIENAPARFKNKAYGEHDLRAAQQRLDKANADLRNNYRELLAMHAQYAFMLLLFGQTGMNAQQVFELPWSDEYEVGTGQQGFRVIKWRAGGQSYKVVIRLTFLDAFKKYLQLRQWLLNGRQCGTLFFTFGANKKESPSPVGISTFQAFVNKVLIARIDPSLKAVLTRQLRAAKDDWHLRNSDVETTSVIMGRAESTTRKNYAAGSKTTHYREVTDFFETVAQSAINKITVLSGDQAQPGVKVSPAGGCLSFNHPKALDASPIAPDCGKPEGCLFCENHRVCADEKDTRKLVSLRYVIVQVTHNPEAEAHFNPILARVNSILTEIQSRPGKTSMVERVVREVEDDGDLDPYWEGKLVFLQNLGFAI